MTKTIDSISWIFFFDSFLLLCSSLFSSLVKFSFSLSLSVSLFVSWFVTWILSSFSIFSFSSNLCAFRHRHSIAVFASHLSFVHLCMCCMFEQNNNKKKLSGNRNRIKIKRQTDECQRVLFIRKSLGIFDFLLAQ